ncbi:MAG: antibiotic biosynthesis monooxygenase [Clostridia bacterium]|nr:antibiotic biosynthesis monooxygenase [Clostridia bacterium]
MIKIVAKQIIRKECIEKYRELTKELVEKSSAEAGNITYTSNQSIADERVHCFIEIWKDQEAIDIHNASEHFQRIIPQLAELFDGPEVVDLYTEVEF